MLQLGKYFIIVCLLLIGCATRPWTTQEKILLGASCLATVADTYTTTRFLDNEDNWEINPMLGRHPSDTKVVIYMFSSQMIVVLLAHYFPSLRIPLLGTKTVVNTGFALHNTTLE